MSNQITTINGKTIKALFDEIEFYRKGLSNLRIKLLKVIPEEILPYGSDLWWEKSELEVDIDIKKGNVSKSYTEVEEFIVDLHKGVLPKK